MPAIGVKALISRWIVSEMYLWKMLLGDWTESGFPNHETTSRGGFIGFNLADIEVPAENLNNL